MATLLERIRRADGTVRRDVRGSVLENVRRICSSRLGDAPACPTYGLPDMLHARTMLPDAGQTVLRALQATIAAYEPRLTAVRVQQVAVTGDIALRFEITGQLAGRAGAMTIRTELGAGSLKME